MELLAFVSGNGMMNLLIQLVIGGLIFFCIWYFVTWIGVPQPFLKVIQVVLGLCALIFLVNILSSLGNGVGGHGFLW